MADIDLPSTQRVNPEKLERSKRMTHELLHICYQDESSDVVMNALLSALMSVAYATNRLDEMPDRMALFLDDVAYVQANVTSLTLND